jgi:ABC-type multidrug transport system fused ATPase/permease subunit
MNSNTHDPEIAYQAGDILSCFFGIVFGVFSLAMANPNIKALTEGKVAGKLAYDIIERVPKILIDDPLATRIKENEKIGQIEFKNVSFSYPSRPN